MGNLISIIKELKESRLFAVIIDTTTNNVNIEKFTFVVKYIHEGIKKVLKMKKYDSLNFHRNKH